MTEKRALNLSFLLLLGLCSTLAPMAMNMHVPVMAEVAQTIGVARDTASLTVTVYLWFFGGAMLFVGLPANRFGRRPTLIIGLAILLFGAVFAMFARSLPLILAARAIEAVGAAAVIVIPRTMINDRVEGADAVKYLGLLGTIMAAAPAMAPIFGEVLSRLWGWQTIFGFQALVGVACIAWCLRALPETHPASVKRAPVDVVTEEDHVSPRASEYAAVVGPVAVMALTMALYFAFLAAGADALLVHFSGESWMVAALLGALAVVYVSGNMLVSRLSRRFTAMELLFAGTFLLLVSLPLNWFASQLSYWAVVVSMCVYALGNGLITPTALALAGGVHPSKRAVVMSIASATPYLLGGILASITVALGMTTWPRFMVVMVVCAVVSFALAWWSWRAAAARLPQPS